LAPLTYIQRKLSINYPNMPQLCAKHYTAHVAARKAPGCTNARVPGYDGHCAKHWRLARKDETFECADCGVTVAFRGSSERRPCSISRSAGTLTPFPSGNVCRPCEAAKRGTCTAPGCDAIAADSSGLCQKDIAYALEAANKAANKLCKHPGGGCKNGWAIASVELCVYHYRKGKYDAAKVPA
jgi:hypothetical protein